jgi:pimeloyl-ACP methyl ester carboxylesterase
MDLLEQHPRATLAVIDKAGHALPHERPELLRALILDWLAVVDRAVPPTAGER